MFAKPNAFYIRPNQSKSFMIFVDYFPPSDTPVEYTWCNTSTAVFDNHIPTNYAIEEPCVGVYKILLCDTMQCRIDQMRFIFSLTKVKVL